MKKAFIFVNGFSDLGIFVLFLTKNAFVYFIKCQNYPFLLNGAFSFKVELKGNKRLYKLIYQLPLLDISRTRHSVNTSLTPVVILTSGL